MWKSRIKNRTKFVSFQVKFSNEKLQKKINKKLFLNSNASNHDVCLVTPSYQCGRKVAERRLGGLERIQTRERGAERGLRGYRRGRQGLREGWEDTDEGERGWERAERRLTRCWEGREGAARELRSQRGLTGAGNEAVMEWRSLRTSN